MHYTEILLKDGRKIEARPIKKQYIDYKNFENSYIKLIGNPEIFYVYDINTAVTKDVMLSVSKFGDCDEIESMRQEFERGRKYGK